METMNSVIEYVDRIKINAYTDDDKYKWLNNLDGMISTEIMNYYEPIEYELPRDADTPLLVSHPYDDIYALYVMAMIDFHNKEYASYNNTMLMFQEIFNSLKTHYIRRFIPSSARNFRNVMG